MVDYLDSELTYTWENADVWKQISAEDLKANGFISKETQDTIKKKGYVAYIKEFTDLAPGDSEQYYVSAKKLLANQDENVYDNHVEILQIDAKTARTNKQTGVTKEYKMGNYVPSLKTRKINTDINTEKEGRHEQDDDRIKIVVTPPTGVIEYITTYAITGLVGLIAIAVVVIFIKKKVYRR